MLPRAFDITISCWSAILCVLLFVELFPENITFLATSDRIMPSLGKIEEFNPASTNIHRYLKRLEQYFVANGVPADSAESHKRRATLISVIGSKAYDVLSDLCSPTAPSAKTYAQLATILMNHFAPKKLVIAERYRFHNCIQREGESVATFAANLKHLASTCNFGTHLNEGLRDRFVCGLRSKEIQKKLLTEEHTFDEALKNALGTEAAEKDVAAFSQDTATPVNKLDSGYHRTFRPRKSRKPPGKVNDSKNPSQHNNNSTSECLSCGKTGHPRSQCKYRNYTCHSCGRSGHITDACKSKSQKVHKMEEPVSPQADDPSSVDPFSFALYNLNTDRNGIEIPVELNGAHLLMELDTGAGVSIISQETYNRYFNGTPLQPSSTRLHTYTGYPVQVSGQFHAQLKYQNQCVTVPLLVVEGSGPSLFGRDWLSRVKLDWKKICSIHVSDAGLPQDIKTRLHTTIQSHPSVFQPGLGTIRGITAKLEMKTDAQPKFYKARPVPYALQEAVEAEYNRLESEGIVERVEFSEWATPMVHVPEADGTTRSCGDYAVTVNPQLNVPQYPIPLPEDVFVKLRGGTRFSKLDLKSAYQQLPLDPDSQQFVPINTHRGLYRYKRLPFGIASSPAIFQRTMDVILQGLEHVASIQDDILITGKDDDQHIKNLNTVLSRLHDYGLRLQLNKCKFMQKSVTYMGCIISAEGISPTDEKVEAIKQAPRPENSTQLRSFLGMINYHGKFIRNLSSILQPLNKLLQKNQAFVWSPQCEETFNKARDSLSSSHVLVHYDPSLPVILESDASQYGIGAVILHHFPNGDERPIAYASRSLNSSEKNYSQIEKEGLAIIFGVTKYYMYLFGRKFTLRTDHKPLLKIFAPDSATPVLAAARLQRWSLLLSSYQYEIEFKPSAGVASADALSRLPLQYKKDASVEDRIFHVATQQLNRHPVSASEIARETSRNPTLAKALSLTQNGWPVNFCSHPELKPFFHRKHELSVEQGCLMWGLRTIIPPTLQQPILRELHKAHPGVACMKATARSHVWWPGIDGDIEETARKCQQCIKTRKAPPAAPLFPWSWPTTPWQRIHVDFATHQSNHYLVIVDAHSKWPEVIGPMKTTTAESTTNAMRNIFARYGLPTQVVSDNGPPFQSAEYEEFLRQNGIQRILVSPYHPSSNGLAERFVQTFKFSLESSASDPACSLQQRIQNFLLSYRSTPHATTGLSPAKLFLQRELRTRLSLVRPDLTSHVTRQQDKMKLHHDKHAKFREIAVGDTVLARDHLSSQKWQSGTVRQHTSPHSYRVQLDDGRVWRRHVDDVLQNNPSLKPTESRTPLVEAMAPANSAEVNHHPQPSVSAAPPQDNVSPKETPPVPASPVLRRSMRSTKPPQRLIEQM